MTVTGEAPGRPPVAGASLCGMLGSLLRLSLAVMAVLALVGGVAELVLRAGGAGPRVAVGLTETVPDRWTAFRLRPGMEGPEAWTTNELGLHAPRPYTLTPPPPPYGLPSSGRRWCTA